MVLLVREYPKLLDKLLVFFFSASVKLMRNRKESKKGLFILGSSWQSAMLPTGGLPLVKVVPRVG